MNTQNRLSLSPFNWLTSQAAAVVGANETDNDTQWLFMNGLADHDALLADLEPLNGAQLKGGDYVCPTWRCGFNHNETTANDETEETDEELSLFDDLALNAEQLGQIKGGPTEGGIWRGVGGLNHN